MTNYTANWSMILEYLKVFLSWPPIVFALSLYFLIAFRLDIGRLLARVKSMKFLGGEINAAQADIDKPDRIETRVIEEAKDQQSDANRGSASLTGPTPHLAASGRNHLAEAAPPDADAAQQVEPLKRALDVAVKWLHYERSLNSMFGTQYELLLALQTRPSGIALEEVRYAFFAKHQALIGPIAVGLEQWMQWLAVIGFVEFRSMPAPSYYLTADGRRFLEYVRQTYPVGVPYRAN